MTELEERITLTAKMFSNIKDEKGKENSSVNNDVKIVFEEGVCPKTDGKVIYLPTDMNEDRLWELLGALLHECFHIRFTEMETTTKAFLNDANLFYCLNALEDMRINWKALQIFPKTKMFFHALYYYIAKSKKEELMQEPIAFQIIKTLLLSNEDFPVYSEKAQELIKQHDIMRFQKIAREAKCVTELERPAKELFLLLKKITGEELNNLGDDDLINMLKKMKQDLENKIKAKSSEGSDLNDQLNELYKKQVELEAEYKREHRKMKTNNTRSGNLLREADGLDKEADQKMSQGQQTEASQLRDQANHKRDLSSGASNRGSDAEIKLSENKQKTAELQKQIDALNRAIYAIGEELNQLRKYLEDLLKNGGESTTAGFGYSPMSVNGLDALDKNDLIYEHSYKLPKKLEDVLREVFLKKKEEREIDDEGNRMNRKNLYRIVTDNQNLFETPVQPFDKTKIAFLLDASGSMCGSRVKIVNTAFAYLYNSLNEVLVSEGLDVQIGVWGFDHRLLPLKEFEEEKSGEEIIKTYRASGGTRILENLNKVINKMESTGGNEKRIVILLTDAEVGNSELLDLKNNVNFEDIKVVFIGVELRNFEYKNELVKELFMDNITKDNDVVEILTNALVRNL